MSFNIFDLKKKLDKNEKFRLLNNDSYLYYKMTVIAKRICNNLHRKNNEF